MLAGPFYPILRLVNEREAVKTLLNPSESDASKGNQASMPTVSSNFEAQPRRSRSPSLLQPASSSIAFRSDAVIVLLRKAYKDAHLGIVCRRASRALQKLGEPIKPLDESVPDHDLTVSSISDEVAKVQVTNHVHLADYSSLFGEEFKILESSYDDSYLNVLDIAAVEEGILHVLYASASQPLLCCKLAENSSNLWSILPLIQALLPALRPPINSSPVDQVDDSFFQWKHPTVQHAFSQIVNMSSSSVYHPLLHACAGYLSSFMSSHGKAACVLIDLCSGPLSPWIPIIIAKMDLTIELLEDLLGVIQGARQSINRARAALKYVILAISGHMDDVLAKYKEVKHKLLFLLEMLEPFLDPAITAMKNTIAFGDVSAVFLERQESICAVALNVIRTAVQRPAVLPSLESEWRRGSVAPSVLLSILCPNMPLPPDIDLCRGPPSKVDPESLTASPGSTVHPHGGSSISCSSEDIDGKIDTCEGTLKTDVFGDSNLLFAPRELKQCVLTSLANPFRTSPDKINLESSNGSADDKHTKEKTLTGIFQLDNVFAADYYNMQADYLQLIVHKDCELRTAEFQRLSLDLCSQHDITPEGHDAGIDALLLAAECYVNPFFMISFRPNSELIKQMNSIHAKLTQENAIMELSSNFQRKKIDLETVAHLEKNRDKAVLDILLQAAKLDSEYHGRTSYGEPYADDLEEDEQSIEISQGDIQFADAVTLVRKNQALLCHFIVRQFQREQHSSHEVLLRSLLFLLQSATKLFCAPENVIDIILQSAENLNGQLASLYSQVKEGKMQLDMEKLHGLQRRWGLLKNLVLASSGNDDVMELLNITKNGFHYRSLVPPSSWMQKISKFSNYACPLPRFLGWMAVSRYAKQYLSGRLFLASDFSQLTSLLSIFADELAFIDNIVRPKVEAANMESFETKCLLSEKEFRPSSPSDTQDLFKVLHPDMHLFFPTMKNQFGSFEEIILEAVGLHLKCLPCSAVADVLCWFSDICLWPYVESVKDSLPYGNTADSLKRYTAVNAKTVVLYLIESIVREHMEAIIPEMPRVAHILVSLTKASYSDVTFLESVLCLLRPLISYFLRRMTEDEKLLANGSNTQDFELLNFDELFKSMRCKKEPKDVSGENNTQVALVIFILGYLFPDLSLRTKIEILESLLLWVDFTTSEPTSSFHNYLSAFQKVMDSCDVVLERNVKLLGINIPLEREQLSETVSSLNANDNLHFYSNFPDSADQSLIWQTEYLDIKEPGAGFSGHEIDSLSASEMKEFSDVLEKFITQLVPAVEASWKLHYKLSMKLVVSAAKCMLFSRCLHYFFRAGTLSGNSNVGHNFQCGSSELPSQYWTNALVDLAGLILMTQQNQCWQVANSMLDYLLELPNNIFLDCVLSKICTAIKNFCRHAPRISWRLQTDKWLSSLVTRGIDNFRNGETALVDLFCTMLGHPEPEQRSIALHHLGRITNVSSNVEVNTGSYRIDQQLVGSHSAISLSESAISSLVSKTWDIVAALGLSDPSMLLRLNAMALLSCYIPFAERNQLCTFLVSSNTILQCTSKLSQSIEESYLTQLSLVLLANACLYSPAEDIALIPESVWRNLETMGKSRTGLAYMEKKLCQALCKLRSECDGGKSALKQLLSASSTVKHTDPSFKNTRESILQVLSSLTSVKSYFDFFSRRIDQESQEIEEAEIEMEILQKEKALQEVSDHTQEDALQNQTRPNYKVDIKANDRLQQIKDNIRSLERSKLKEEIIVRRQKKLLIKHARQKYLEEANSREMELLQELDRERAREMERELERQRQLELERAKTRELQFNLDLEREKQTQRDLQQELEQVESGVRSSRRDYSSNANSRPRERYHERENVRTGRQEGNIRSSSRGRESATSQMVTSNPSVSPSPNIVLAGSRSFSGHVPTILQSRDRTEERSVCYEDSIEGSKDSGDASSIGDPELGSAFDGLAGGYGSVSRHGSRGSKSRQVVERRERDGRREGKWERKHS
ncbi:uncharacterized protein [Typha angustifolia]